MEAGFELNHLVVTIYLGGSQFWADPSDSKIYLGGSRFLAKVKGRLFCWRCFGSGRKGKFLVWGMMLGIPSFHFVARLLL